MIVSIAQPQVQIGNHGPSGSRASSYSLIFDLNVSESLARLQRFTDATPNRPYPGPRSPLATSVRMARSAPGSANLIAASSAAISAFVAGGYVLLLLELENGVV